MKKRVEVVKSAEEVEREFRRKCLGEAGISFSAGAALIILVAAIFSFIVSASVKFPVDPLNHNNPIYPDWYLYLNFLIPQFCLAGACLIYFLRTKERVTVLTRGCKWYYFLIAIALQLGLMFPLSELNDLFIKGLEALGYHSSGVNVPSLDGWKVLPAILVIAVLPAVFEETLFRGILSRNMHASGWGLLQTVMITGAMFSLYHGNPEQTLYQFASGICLTFVAVKSGSVFPTMLAHFMNNGLILALQAAFNPDGTQQNLKMTDIMPLSVYIAVIVVSALLFLGALAFLIFFDKRNNQKGKVTGGKKFFFGAAAGIGVCAIEWIVQLVMGIRG